MEPRSRLHIADCEHSFAERIKRTVAMDRPLLLGVDGFRYPEPLRYQEHGLDEELDLVAVTRREVARTLGWSHPMPGSVLPSTAKPD